METYDVDYFIKKFEAIPEWKWWVGNYCNGLGSFCAYGHCGYEGDSNRTTRQTKEGDALGTLFREMSPVHEINDGKDSQYQQPTPKQRILAALMDIKAKQEAERKVTVYDVPTPQEVKERTVYVTVDQAVRKLQKEIAEN